MNRFISRLEKLRAIIPEATPFTVEFSDGHKEYIYSIVDVIKMCKPFSESPWNPQSVAHVYDEFGRKDVGILPVLIDALLTDDDALVESIPEVMDPPPDAPEDDEPPAYLVDSSDDEDEDELHEVIAPLLPPLSNDSRVQEIHEQKPKRTSIHG